MKSLELTPLTSTTNRLARCSLLVLSSIVLVNPAHAQIQSPVAAPAPKVGEIVKYRNIDLWNNKELSTSESELVSVEEDAFVSRFKDTINPAPRTNRFNRSWQPCRNMQGSDKAVCAGALSFPMQIGSKHSYDKLPWPSGLGHSSANCEVKSEEKLTVPAGTYDTLRITCSGYWNRVFEGTFSGRYNETVWYAPAISRLVKSEYFDFQPNGAPFNKNQSVLIEIIGAK